MADVFDTLETTLQSKKQEWQLSNIKTGIATLRNSGHDSFAQHLHTIASGQIVNFRHEQQRNVDSINSEQERLNLISNMTAYENRLTESASNLRRRGYSTPFYLVLQESLIALVVIFGLIQIPVYYFNDQHTLLHDPGWKTLALVLFLGYVAFGANMKLIEEELEKVFSNCADILCGETKQVRNYISQLNDHHNTNLIRTRELNNLSRQGAVATAQEVGEISVRTAKAAAAITEELIAKQQAVQEAGARNMKKMVDDMFKDLTTPSGG